MFRDWQRREIQVCGVRVSALERPSGEGAAAAPFLLLHGLVAEGETFRSLMSELPPDRRVVALDLPGAGYSERPRSVDVGLGGMAEVVRSAARELGMERPVILGHSHGGAVTLRLAASHGDELSGVVLLCPAHPFSGREDNLVRFYLSPPGRAFARLLPHLPSALHLWGFRAMPGRRDALGRAEMELHLRTLKAPGTVAHLLRLLKTWIEDMRVLGEELRARSLELPVLMLWGNRDMVVPLATAVELASAMRRVKLVPLPGVGHLPNEEAPVECAQEIAVWLEECGLRQTATER